MVQEITITEKHVQVRLSGGIYVEEAARIRESLTGYIQEGRNRFTIDLGGVDYIDSSGLGMLIAIHKMTMQKGGGIVITGLKGLVRELFVLTRLTKVFEIQ